MKLLPRQWFRHVSALGRRATIAIFVVLALMLCAATTTTVLFGHSTSQHSAAEAAARAARDSAQSRIPTVLSYDFNTIDTEFPKVTDNLTGTFRDDFSKLSSTVIIPAAHRDSIVTTAKVVETSVVTATVDKVAVLLFLDQETTSSKYQGPRLDGSRIRVTMTHADDRWLISDITPV
ncbi:hypothetical protein OIE68_01880 [Nocardia vinacea]|uniref:Mce-associated membrane protein n=1 Tax=Nocardia vinacea TaxID=96468 RepID=A0ABZ1YLY7_9NOCA|nr:hypothetical protein OIE68_01880 [Nocardia vinacea]